MWSINHVMQQRNGVLMDRKRITREVAEALGIPHKTLTMFILRNPEVKPAEKLPSGEYLWSDDEIATLAQRRGKRKRRTLKPKQPTVVEVEVEVPESQSSR